MHSSHVSAWSSRVGAVVALSLAVGGCGDSGGKAGGGSGGGNAAKTETDSVDTPTYGANAAGDHTNSASVAIRLEFDWQFPVGDPATVGTSGPAALYNSLYDRLITLDDKGQLIPYLAESWEATPEQVTFTLKTGPTCADGTPLTPTAVKQSLDHVLSSETSPLGAYTGAGPFEVTADDAARTVTVTTETPNNEMAIAFTNEASGIACPAAFEKGADVKNESFGSGPYVIESVTPGQSMTMKKRPEWNWGPMGSTAATLPDELQFKVIDSDATAANLLTTGDLDIARITGPDVKRLERDSDLLHFSAASTFNHHVMFNMSRPLFADPLVREGILTAIDRKQALQAFFGSPQPLSGSILSPGMDCYKDFSNLIPKSDPARAKELLLQAGYTEQGGKLVKDGKPLTIKLLGGGHQGVAPEYISDALGAVGVTVELRDIPISQYVQPFLNGEFDLTYMNNIASTPGPTEQARVFSGPLFADGGNNYMHVTDDDINRLVSEAIAAPLDQRCATWEQLQEVYLNKHYSLPLGPEVNHYFSRGVDFLPNLFGPEPWSLGRRAE